MKILSTLFFLVSFVSLALFFVLWWIRTTPRHVSFDLKESPFVTQSSDRVSVKAPVGIVIEKIDVWLPVYSARINNGIWETTNKGVSFLADSGIVGIKGNAIFYGHNWPNLLGKLPDLTPGDKIKVIFADNSELIFTVETTQEVSPKDISVLAETKAPRLTIYTCSGFLDSKRFVVVATETQV